VDTSLPNPATSSASPGNQAVPAEDLPAEPSSSDEATSSDGETP
jgi:hypothetical protein